MLEPGLQRFTIDVLVESLKNVGLRINTSEGTARPYSHSYPLDKAVVTRYKFLNMPLWKKTSYALSGKLTLFRKEDREDIHLSVKNGFSIGNQQFPHFLREWTFQEGVYSDTTLLPLKEYDAQVVRLIEKQFPNSIVAQGVIFSRPAQHNHAMKHHRLSSFPETPSPLEQEPASFETYRRRRGQPVFGAGTSRK